MARLFYKIHLKQSNAALTHLKVPPRMMDEIINLYTFELWNLKQFYYLVYDETDGQIEWGFCNPTISEYHWLIEHEYEDKGTFNLRKEKLLKLGRV